MRDLPPPHTPDQFFMAGVCERLDAQNALLGEIRDRLGQSNDATPPSTGPDGLVPVGLREPAVDQAAAGSEPQKIELREPDPAVAAPNTNPRRRRTAAKKGT